MVISKFHNRKPFQDGTAVLLIISGAVSV